MAPVVAIEEHWIMPELAASLDALPSVLGLLYVVVIATLVGYGVWNTLLSRHPSSVVAPFSMLVPVVGVFTSWIAFGELIDPVELVAGAAVVLGVLFASRPPHLPPYGGEPAGLRDIAAERAPIQ